MMKQANLHSAAFGRGVKPIGFDNEVLPDDQFTSQYSEMNWGGPDGSEIFGLLLPIGIPMAMRFRLIGKKHTSFGPKRGKDVEKFGSTNHYLMMNGVDHQPVQKISVKRSA